MSEPYRITAGILPLLDSALLVAAREKGFAARENIELVLVRENSWASIRDRLAVGHFNAAHMLAPMPIACNLGLSPLAAKTIAPMALGLGGNAVTVSREVWDAMRAHGAVSEFDPARAGEALKAVVAERRGKNREPLKFSVVHPHSGHNYELRYWLSASGISPDQDIEIVIVPPPLVPEALAAKHIDGYCVGEPWNTAAVRSGVGHIVTTKAAIWRSSPEKVLGVAEPWAKANPEALEALLRALYSAAQWCGTHSNHDELAKILSARDYVDAPAEWLLPALSGVIEVGANERVEAAEFFVPHAKAATFPWRSHALWFYSQMVRWGQVEATAGNEAIARDTYRADLYRSAIKPLGVALPGASAVGSPGTELEFAL